MRDHFIYLFILLKAKYVAVIKQNDMYDEVMNRIAYFKKERSFH